MLLQFQDQHDGDMASMSQALSQARAQLSSQAQTFHATTSCHLANIERLAKGDHLKQDTIMEPNARIEAYKARERQIELAHQTFLDTCSRVMPQA